MHLDMVAVGADRAAFPAKILYYEIYVDILIPVSPSWRLKKRNETRAGHGSVEG
jgi:hypothetical protein